MSTAPDEVPDMMASHLPDSKAPQPATTLRTRLAGFARRHYWVWPIFAALCFGLATWLVYAKMKGIMLERTDAKLVAIRNAEVKSLRTWKALQERQAAAMAARVKSECIELFGAVHADGKGSSAAALAESPHQKIIRETLKPMLVEMHSEGYMIANASGVIYAASDNAALDQMFPGSDAAGFYKSVLDGSPKIVPKHRLDWALAGADGIIRADKPNLILVAVPLSAPGAAAENGVVAVAFKADDECSSILKIGQFETTGETYAFDTGGTMLSKTLFDACPIEGAGPQLAESVKEATPSGKLSDVLQYRNYHDKLVIGAWEWLTDFGFGVVTEVTEDEAFAPLGVLKYAFFGLFAVLLLSAVGLFLVMRVVAGEHEDIQEALEAAKQLGQYHLEEKLGEGGMGVVFKASHAMLRRPTAVKLLSGDKISAESVARFEREVQATANLNHPNTICIYDYGRTPTGDFYYAMEFLDGINLEALVKEFGPQSDARVIFILKQICGSLAEAHDAGLIHRDIKPANIVLNRRGGLFDFVKVLDFGLVKPVGNSGDPGLTAVNAFVGTPLFVGPEMFSGPSKADARSDLYAVGAVGYFLLTGKPVFEGRNMVQLCGKITKELPPAMSPIAGRIISPSLENVIRSCLEKLPDQRPTSAGRLIDLLNQCDVAPPWTTADAELWWRNSFPTHSMLRKSQPRKPGEEATLVVKKI